MDAPLEWDIVESLGVGGALNPVAIRSLECTGIGLKGPTATVGHRSYNVALREHFGLFANVRPIHSVPGIKTRFSDVPIDLTIIRQGTEDIYIGEESEIRDGVEAISRMTQLRCREIAGFAFYYASTHDHRPRKVTVIHKANILPMTHGLFLDSARHVSQFYAEVAFEEMIADAFMMKLVQNPERFDIILAPNFLGDLVSDLAAGLVGGLGFAAGWNHGRKVSVFETVHGTGPDIAGKGVANPTAMMLTAAMLLGHLLENDLAAHLRNVLAKVLTEGNSVTRDVNPGAHISTEDFASAVIAAL